MISRTWNRTVTGHKSIDCLLGLVGLGLHIGPIWADPPPAPDSVPSVLTLGAAVLWALEPNPELAALRQQHGIAAAAVVIAQTYPFNPVWEGKIRSVSAPITSGVTNRVSNEHKFLIDLEIRGQGKYRRQGA